MAEKNERKDEIAEAISLAQLRGKSPLTVADAPDESEMKANLNLPKAVEIAGQPAEVIPNPSVKQENEEQEKPMNWNEWILDQRKKLEESEKEYADNRSRENSSRKISAIADALSSVAGMAGVSAGGNAIGNPNSYKYIDDSIVRDQKIRQANIERLRSNLANNMYRLQSIETQRERIKAMEEAEKGRAERNAANANVRLLQNETRNRAIDASEKAAEYRHEDAQASNATRERLAGINNSFKASESQKERDLKAEIARQKAEEARKKEERRKKINAVAGNWENLTKSSDFPREARLIVDTKERENYIEQFAAANPEWARSVGLDDSSDVKKKEQIKAPYMVRAEAEAKKAPYMKK